MLYQPALGVVPNPVLDVACSSKPLICRAVCKDLTTILLNKSISKRFYVKPCTV